jgi:hypothetical protein
MVSCLVQTFCNGWERSSASTGLQLLAGTMEYVLLPMGYDYFADMCAVVSEHMELLCRAWLITLNPVVQSA